MPIRSSIALCVLFYLPGIGVSQEQPQPAPPATPAVPADSAKAGAPSKSKTKVIPSFLIIGTVFNENALSFPGVQVRIRRSGEKKFQYETYTDSRGEFAVRVPPGYDYEVVTHVKRYDDQSRTVDSKQDVQQRLSIKLEPQNKGKTGTKS